jgi:transcriptional regulator with XRE-family HTH domain
LKKLNLIKLKKLREQTGFSQEEISKKLGYKSALGYHYIETGRCKPNAEHIFTLAALYEINPDELFFEEKITVLETLKKTTSAS